MKMKLLFLTLFMVSSVYSQGYYPNIDNIFLTNKDEESLFSKDLSFFRDFLKTSTQRVFFSDLQMAPGMKDRYGTVGTFYGLTLFPKGNASYPVMHTGISLLFDKELPNSKSKIPITFDELVFEDNNIKTGRGTLHAFIGGIILEFPKTMIVQLDDKIKKPVTEEIKCQFIIKKIEYDISPKKFKAEITGSFGSFIQFSKNKISPKSVENIILEVSKDVITVKVNYLDKNDQKQSILLVQKKSVTIKD